MIFKGYISSRDLNDQKNVEQNIQNMVIRNCCDKRGFTFLLSATEYGMKNCYLVLNQLLYDINKFDGIAFYSLMQLPDNFTNREKILYSIINEGKKILFSLENILVENNFDIKKIQNISSINNLLKFCPSTI